MKTSWPTSCPSPRVSPSPARLLAIAIFLIALPACLPAQTVTPLYTFTGGTDGGVSLTSLIQASDGNFYGTTLNSGGDSNGSVFRVSPSGIFTTIYSFTGGVGGPYYPYGGVVEGGDGNFYGTTRFGGGGYGIAFKVTPAGAFTMLATFGGSFGEFPETPLIPGADGNFYGTAESGGLDSAGGVIYSLSPAGTLTTLHVFADNTGDGYSPYAGLVQGTDGNFYGTTTMGGTDNLGTAFQLNPSIGSYTLIHSFTGGADGSIPRLPLIENSDGNFYSASASTPNTYDAVLYTLTPSGTLTPVFDFENVTDQSIPNPFFLAGDGNLYDTSYVGGPNSGGSAFAIYPADSYQFDFLYGFATTNANGTTPQAGLIQGSDGNFYGSNSGHGANNFGTIFKLVPASPVAAPVQVTLSQPAVEPATPVTVSFSVNNAFSLTMRQCYGFQNLAGASTPLGLLPGTYSASTKLYTGSISVTPPSAGIYTYAATCGGIESGFATLIVGNATITAFTPPPTPPTAGQPATFEATVIAGYGTPTGKVTFSVNGLDLGAANLNSSGVASFTASSAGFAPGIYPVTATYSGSSSYKSSASTALPVTLSKAPTATKLSASPTSVTSPATVALSATVVRSAAGATGHPSGSVTFSSDGFTIGSAKLNPSGVATFAASSSGIAPSAYPVTATYNGDPSDSASTSSAVTVTVQ